FFIADHSEIWNASMNPLRNLAQIFTKASRSRQRTRQRTTRRERHLASRRTTLRLEQLEDRTVPSTLPGSTFEIDGNLIVNGGAGALDWANAPQLQTATDMPQGQTDNSFGQGTKENTAVPSVVDGSIPNNKSDLTHFYVASEASAANHIFMYLAWERANTLGTANIDFE